MGEEVEEFWADNNNVAIIDFLDDVGQPYSCTQWGRIGNDNLPTIINDDDFDFQNQFHDVYPTNVFINHEMKVHSILDTMHTAGSVNVKIQEMLDNMELTIEENYYSHKPYNYEITNLYPNPFNPILHINFIVAWSGVIQLDILDISGSHIETLYSGYLQSGSHELSWNAESMPSGLYLVSLKSGDESLIEKVVLLK